MADAAWLSMGGTPSPNAWEAAEASPRGDKCSSGASAASTTQSKTSSSAATLPTRIAGSNQPVTQASAPLSTRHAVHLPPQRYLRPPKWRGFLLVDTFSTCFTTTLLPCALALGSSSSMLVLSQQQRHAPVMLCACAGHAGQHDQGTRGRAARGFGAVCVHNTDSAWWQPIRRQWP